MEEKAKSGLKSALSFLEGDVVFYLAEAEKHETGTADTLLIRLIKIAASELVARIRKAIDEEHKEEAVRHCGRCAHVTHCEDVLKYVVPCVNFEERKREREREKAKKKTEEVKHPAYCESCVYFPYCDSTYKESRNEDGCVNYEDIDANQLHANRAE